MNTWDDWSDLEINKRIALILNVVKKGKIDSYYAKRCPDYCNSWEDMGPIITDKAITINRDTCQVHVSSYFAEHIKVSVPPNKTLRAAAIVFLMMNGVNP